MRVEQSEDLLRVGETSGSGVTLLAADAHGLGSGTGWFVPGADGEDSVKELLGIPGDMVVLQAIGIGYPDHADQRARSVQGGRRPIEEIVSRGRFGNR